MRELYPEYAPWATRTKTNYLLADIFDLLNLIRAYMETRLSGKTKVNIPDRYPRPGQKAEKASRHFGTPTRDIEAWLNEKRKEYYARRNAGSRESDRDHNPEYEGGASLNI